MPYIYPKSIEISKIFDDLIKMDGRHGRALKIKPEAANSLSKCKAIRILNEKDMVDILNKRKKGRHNSYIYISPDISIDRTGKKIFLNPKK